MKKPDKAAKNKISKTNTHTQQKVFVNERFKF